MHQPSSRGRHGRRNPFSVTPDEREYGGLAVVARKHRVSMAWLVRHAVNGFRGRRRGEGLRLPMHLTGLPPEYHGA